MSSRDIVPLSLALRQYTSSIASEPSGTGLVGLIVFLHCSLFWSVLYPTIPSLRPTALSYATGGVVATPTGSGVASQTYGAGSDKRTTSKSLSSGKEMEIDEIPLRPITSREGNYTSVTASRDLDAARGGAGTGGVEIMHEVKVDRY